MAVLTSPRRTRPRFGPQAGLVAATRGVAFTGLMLAGLGLLIVIVGAVFFTALGAAALIVGNRGPQDQHMLLALVVLGAGLGLARFAVPHALLGIRGLARLTRQLAGDWCGVPIAERYAPRPDEALTFTGRLRWLATDPATWRDLLVDGGEPGRVHPGRAARRDHRDRPDRVHRTRADPGDPAARVSGQRRGDADRAGPRDRLDRGAGGSGAAARLRPAGPFHPDAGRARRAGAAGQQLTQTRTEALDTGAAEIRRIERDLHDGAQARLVAMGMTLDAAGQIIDTNPEAARALVLEARDASVKALAELRALIRGIHPPVLADRGLADAIRALALDTPARIHLASDLTGRPPAPVESAAYFAVSELLANVSKHAEARQTWVDIRHTDEMLRIGVTDNGHGGAEPARGTGLRGIERRLAAFDGVARDQQPARRPDRGHHGDPVRVVIAEDLFLLRDGLTRMLQAHGLQIAAAVDNGADLLAAVTADQPDVAIVDVRLPPTFTDEGIRAALAARREVPGLPVLVLSQYVEQLYARELLASGSGGIGYLLKDRVFDSGQFVDAVRRVAAGGTAMDPEVIARLLARNTGDGTLATLSPREREVLALMAEGRSNAAIAQRLVITERAVAKHTASIFLKLGLQPSDDDNRRVLAVLAYLGG